MSFLSRECHYWTFVTCRQRTAESWRQTGAFGFSCSLLVSQRANWPAEVSLLRFRVPRWVWTYLVSSQTVADQQSDHLLGFFLRLRSASSRFCWFWFLTRVGSRLLPVCGSNFVFTEKLDYLMKFVPLSELSDSVVSGLSSKLTTLTRQNIIKFMNDKDELVSAETVKVLLASQDNVPYRKCPHSRETKHVAVGFIRHFTRSLMRNVKDMTIFKHTSYVVRACSHKGKCGNWCHPCWVCGTALNVIRKHSYDCWLSAKTQIGGSFRVQNYEIPLPEYVYSALWPAGGARGGVCGKRIAPNSFIDTWAGCQIIFFWEEMAVTTPSLLIGIGNLSSSLSYLADFCWLTCMCHLWSEGILKWRAVYCTLFRMMINSCWHKQRTWGFANFVIIWSRWRPLWRFGLYI